MSDKCDHFWSIQVGADECVCGVRLARKRRERAELKDTECKWCGYPPVTHGGVMGDLQGHRFDVSDCGNKWHSQTQSLNGEHCPDCNMQVIFTPLFPRRAILKPKEPSR